MRHLTVPLIFFVLIFILASSCEVETTPTKLSDVKICTRLEKGFCIESFVDIEPSASNIYVSCILENATDDSTVHFSWFYYEESGERRLLNEVNIHPSELSTRPYSEYLLSSNLSRALNYWPSGRYEIVINLDAVEPMIISKQFEI